MAISYFTRVCVSFLPSIFLPGKRVYVSRFPSFLERFSDIADLSSFDESLNYSESPGWYMVDSVINYRNAVTEIGLEIGDDVIYYAFSDIEITAIAPGER
jgi:hypothetical protein